MERERERETVFRGNLPWAHDTRGRSGDGGRREGNGDGDRKRRSCLRRPEAPEEAPPVSGDRHCRAEQDGREKGTAGSPQGASLLLQPLQQLYHHLHRDRARLHHNVREKWGSSRA